MTIDISTAATDLEVLPAAQPIQPGALGQLMAHAQAMATAKQLADALCETELVPATYRGKPGNGAAAILYGAELGLNPIQSLQQIFVVHGAPAIYARTAVALVKSRAGIVVQTVMSTDDSVTVSAADPVTGQAETATWDIARAERAGYTSNKKYQTNPQEMLYAKAAMEVCRKIAPDVLLGIPYSREELELEAPQPEPRKVVNSHRGLAGLRAGVGLTAAPETVPAAIVSSEPVTDPDDDPQPAAHHAVKTSGDMAQATRKKWLNRMFALFGEADCQDRADQLLVLAAVTGRQHEHRDELTDDELRTVVNTLNAEEKAGTLAAYITDILNRAALAETAAEAE